MDYTTPVLIFFFVLGFCGIVFALILRDTVRGKGVWGINLKKVNCPKCGTTAPQVRVPTSPRQAVWGGWTCRQCSCEMDKWGADITQK